MFIVDGVLYFRQGIALQEALLRALVVRVGIGQFGGATIQAWRLQRSILCFTLQCPVARPEVVIASLEDLANAVRILLQMQVQTQCSPDAVLIDHVGVTYCYTQDGSGDTSYSQAP